MHSLVRTLVAVVLASVSVVLALSSTRASAQQIQHQSSGTARGVSQPLTVAIDGLTPAYASSPTQTITISGTLTNHTGSAMPGISVEAESTSAYFSETAQMETWANTGAFGYGSLGVVGPTVTKTVAPHATVHWSISYTAGLAGYGASEVYPVAVIAGTAFNPSQASARTFLPYWDGSSTQTKLKTAWLWPLIDTPQQGACGQPLAPTTLASNSLAGSLASGGRLSGLLSAGLRWAAKDQLTWVIDPALLSDASAMTKPYRVGGNANCTGAKQVSASAAAAQWLSKLRSGTAGKPAVLTPYADADAAALSHNGLDADLRASYQLGESVADQLLPATFGKNRKGTGGGGAPSVAWPAGGTADLTTLSSLVSDGGVNSVVLGSGALPAGSGQYPDARARTTIAGSDSMPVLLANADLSQALGSAAASSTPAARFAAEQEFFALTEMILEQGPSVQRTLVIAPPQRWDPSSATAARVLGLTATAPWLKSVTLSSLVTASSKVPASSLPASQPSRAELHGGYVDTLTQLDANVETYEDLLYQPPAAVINTLTAAVAATESSAWRGGGAAGGALALGKLSQYLLDQEHQVQLIAGKKILLAGASASIPISVSNGLSLPIAVQFQVLLPPGSKLSVKPNGPLIVPPKRIGTTRLSLQSDLIGTTTMQLQLATTDGAPLTWTGAAQSLSVQVTRFGRALLVVIAGALGVLVLTSVVRLVRKRRRANGGSGSAAHAEDASDVGGKTADKAGAGGTG